MGRSAKLRKQRKAELDETLAVQVFGSVVYPGHLLSPLAISLARGASTEIMKR